MINLKKYTNALFSLFFLLVLAACGNESSGLPSQGGDGGPVGDSDDGSIVSLMIMPENPSVAAGEELQLSVKATQSDGEVIDEVRWFSSDQSIVTVNKDGVMKGIKAGMLK